MLVTTLPITATLDQTVLRSSRMNMIGMETECLRGCLGERLPSHSLAG